MCAMVRTPEFVDLFGSERDRTEREATEPTMTVWLRHKGCLLSIINKLYSPCRADLNSFENNIWVAVESVPSTIELRTEFEKKGKKC